jgi:isoleucyl-tRNA synthetase
MSETRSDWSATVRLPKTDFPMKGDLAKREPELLKVWSDMGLYERLQERQKGRPSFILHDGPPYANGHIHIGTAFNKILKDITVKSRALMGRATPYVPGWDCHGLPIESALLKEMKMSKRGVTDIPKFRRDASAFADRFIGIHREEFQRLGVLGDWFRPYMTKSKEYEAKILRAFRLLVKQGYVYRGLKPVQWCITCETALAEAEVEYKDKVSPSVYVALPLIPFLTPIIVNGKEYLDRISDGDKKLLTGSSLLIWTTTPWTLPANRAAALNPLLEYSLIQESGSGKARKLLVGSARLADVMTIIGVKDYEILKTWKGNELVGTGGLAYTPPYPTKDGDIGVSVLADYVTAEDGTGIVHTAPGHGEDDFHTGQREGLEILNPVDNAGVFTDKSPRWKGKHIFKEGNPEIVADLAERGLLLAKKDITHSYPHCWRCKNPVVFRTTEQWFLRLSDGLREHLLAQIDATRWVPAEGRTRIASMVTNRPDWCLSRQRVWGTPITVLYSAKTGEAVLDDGVLEAIEKKAAADGSDFWFEKWGEVLTRKDWPFLPDHPALKDGFRRESDILDVWLDSGVSWLAVLGEKETADLYLEGSDQHRGWFQSSLVMSTALRGHAPYKTVLTHGFVLDEKGRAMHKSTGNVVAPQEVISKWGADVLRLWTALSDYNDDVRISDKILEGPGESYRRVRNTLRYLLGNLSDFDAKSAVTYEKLPEMERFFLHRLAALQAETLEDYREYRYRAASRRLVDFCSTFYLDVVKDRLYTFRADSPERLAVQTVMAEAFARLCALLSPILSFTADEAWRFWPGRPSESVFLWDLPAPDARLTDAALSARWESALAVRGVAQKSLEEARAAKTIGSSLQAKLVVRGPAAALAPLKGIHLSEFFVVSDVDLQADGSSALSVVVSAAPGAKCPRCWRWQSDVGSNPSQPELCGRCARQL